MKTSWTKLGLLGVGLFTFLFLGGTPMVSAVTSPSSIIGKVKEVRLSQNSDCTSAITVFRNDNASTVDFMTNPTFGDGAIPHGTYHCIAVRFSDVLTVTPQGNDGVDCHAGVPFTQDIFNDPSIGDVSYSPDGQPVNATGSANSPSEDDPWLYFSDVSHAANTNTCFLAPFAQCACVNAGPCRLTPVTVTGDQTHTLVINFDNKVGDFGNGRCEIQFPTISML